MKYVSEIIILTMDRFAVTIVSLCKTLRRDNKSFVRRAQMWRRKSVKVDFNEL